MKRLVKYLIGALSAFVFVLNVNAASATISVSSSTSQVIVGNQVRVSVTISSGSPIGSWEYTLNYDNSVFKLVSSDVELHYASYASNANTKSVTYNYSFQAIKSGSCNFYVDSTAVIGWDESIFGVTNGSRKVNTLTYAEYQASLSNNDNLKSLEVEGYEITPEFKKDVLEYNVKINENETFVIINALAEDNSATVNGDGKTEVSAGSNTIDIVVIAENGSEKTYKVNVEVVDKNPIEVTVDKKNYTVVKLSKNLTKPESYNEKTIFINEKEVPAFYSDITKFTLVGLKSDNGDIELYIYDDGEYIKYTELSLGSITIYPLKIEETLKNYVKSTVKINNNNVECLELNADARFKILYGINVETAEKTLYLYDTKDHTLIKYDNEYVKILENKNMMLTYCTLAFIASTLLAMFAVLKLLKNSKRKKKQEDLIKKELIKPIIQEKELEKTKEIPEIKSKNKLKTNKNSKEENENVSEQTVEVYDIFGDDKKNKRKRK